MITDLDNLLPPPEYGYSGYVNPVTPYKAAYSQRQMTEVVILLRDLATALDNAFISTWQTTSAWQKELDAALKYLQQLEKKGD